MILLITSFYKLSISHENGISLQAFVPSQAHLIIGSSSHIVRSRQHPGLSHYTRLLQFTWVVYYNGLQSRTIKPSMNHFSFNRRNKHFSKQCNRRVWRGGRGGVAEEKILVLRHSETQFRQLPETDCSSCDFAAALRMECRAREGGRG